ISGRNEQMPGKPLVYATSKTFMDYFGINTAADLPKIKEVLAEQIVEGTIIKPEDFTDQPVAHSLADADGVEGDVSDITVNEEGTLIVKKDEATNTNETDATQD
ncbi:MAG: SMC-Scp complex subunit ScpB, partial [Chitinophagaceae bacterium]|nr:SMC-Scp complex subunit ScpB [Chitinophagaceae bacterium]